MKNIKQWLKNRSQDQLIHANLDFISEIINDYVTENKINNVDWEKLREAYFNECVDKTNGKSKLYVCLSPHDLFNWFKNEIEEYTKPNVILKDQSKIESAKKQLQDALELFKDKELDRCILHDYITDSLQIIENINVPDVINWIEYDSEIELSHPEKKGKYLICEIDDNIHEEVWNGDRWAHNEDFITHYAEIILPNLK